LNPVLIDTDAYTKLEVADLLDDALALIGSNRALCSRLPALPHMLRRGRLRKSLGADVADALSVRAAQLGQINSPSSEWLERLTPIADIDPGEALLFAAAAEQQTLVITADKRALYAVKSVPGFAERLSDHVVTLEALWKGLCQAHGVNEVRQHVEPLKPLDRVVEIAFSAGNSNPLEALDSYLNECVTSCHPMRLWLPGPGSPS
jgi:hypothetical protein